MQMRVPQDSCSTGRFYRQFFCLSRLRKTHGNAKKMRWVLLSTRIMFREVVALVHLIESIVETSVERVGRPLDRAA